MLPQSVLIQTPLATQFAPEKCSRICSHQIVPDPLVDGTKNTQAWKKEFHQQPVFVSRIWERDEMTNCIEKLHHKTEREAR